MHTFTSDGVSFRYPENWSAEADEDADGGGWTATVTSPETAFVMLALRPDARDPADLADKTLDVLKGDYKELDAENRVETIAGRMAIGFDADFLTLDTATACRVRCLDTPAGPLLVMTQVSEYDRERNDPVLRAVVASLTVDEE